MAERERSGSNKPRLLPNQFGLLIDENLTPDLVKLARRRGFPASHVNDAGLRTASDKAVAQYAVRRGLVVVTNNMVDFRRIYARRRMHPGLIFLTSVEEDAFTGVNQAILLNIALDDILANDLLQEVVLVRLLSDAVSDIEYELTRAPASLILTRETAAPPTAGLPPATSHARVGGGRRRKCRVGRQQ